VASLDAAPVDRGSAGSRTPDCYLPSGESEPFEATDGVLRSGIHPMAASQALLSWVVRGVMGVVKDLDAEVEEVMPGSFLGTLLPRDVEGRVAAC